MKRIKILWVSPFVPYRTVSHAGGKSHNYYVRSIAADPRFRVTLISFGQNDEKSKIDLNCDDIDLRLDFLSPGWLAKAWRGITLFMPFSRFGQFFRFPQFRANLRRRLKELKSEKYMPDVVFLEWTQVAFFYRWIRKLFPGVPLVMYEHDIAFQAACRHLQSLKGIRRVIGTFQFKRLVSSELDALGAANIVVVHNCKDRALLTMAGVAEKKLKIIPLYFDDYSHVVGGYRPPHLVFWGAMSRPENYRSVTSFLLGPWKRIKDLHPNVILYVVGGGPPNSLNEIAGEGVEITGFVEDPAKYFSKASIMVAPLIAGGGLKVKVLESMSAGLAVVGNDIAMEGIGGENGVHHLLANSDDEFVEAVSRLICNDEERNRIAKSGQKFVADYFDFRGGLEKMGEVLESMALNVNRK